MLDVRRVPGRALGASGWQSLRCPSMSAGLESAHLLPQHPRPHPTPYQPMALGPWLSSLVFSFQRDISLLCWLQGFKGEILAWSGIWTKPGFNYPALSPSPERAMNRACGSWLCLSPAPPPPSNNPPLDPAPPISCEIVPALLQGSASQYQADITTPLPQWAGQQAAMA